MAPSTGRIAILVCYVLLGGLSDWGGQCIKVSKLTQQHPLGLPRHVQPCFTTIKEEEATLDFLQNQSSPDQNNHQIKWLKRTFATFLATAIILVSPLSDYSTAFAVDPALPEPKMVDSRTQDSSSAQEAPSPEDGTDTVEGLERATRRPQQPPLARERGGPPEDRAMRRQAELYRVVMDTGDLEFMAAANRQLLDQVWGTIGTMYYDATGGLRFSPGYEWRRYWNELVRDRSASFRSVEKTREEIRRMLAATGDPYAEYLSPEELFPSLGRPKAQSPGGGRGGGARPEGVAAAAGPAGVGLQAVNQAASPALLVTAVSPLSSAERAGIEIDDYIVSVGDWSASTSPELSQDEIRKLLSGNEGEEVEIGVMKARTSRKKGEQQSSAKIPPLTSSVIDTPFGKAEYIRLHLFDRRSTDELIDVLKSMKEKEISDLILDLRNNLGGVVQESLFASSLFFDDPKVELAYIMNSRGMYSDHDVEEFSTQPRSPGCLLKGGHVVILTNKGTASSAELFTAALHDNGRAVVLGENTFGKSLIQHYFPLPDGGSMKLTVAEYLTPRQRHLVRNDGLARAGGLRPDAACPARAIARDPVAATEDECLRRALLSLGGGGGVGDPAATAAALRRPGGGAPGAAAAAPPPGGGGAAGKAALASSAVGAAR